jgi:probable addiction module antidote protein
MALRDVAEARGMVTLAKESDLNRENLYRMLSAKGNPQMSSLSAILKNLGLRLSVDVMETTASESR